MSQVTSADSEETAISYSVSKVCKYLRKAAVEAGLFDQSYDEPFNYVRFAIGNRYNMRAAKIRYLDHLRMRRNWRISSIEQWHKDDEVSEKYFPLGLIGETGKDNRLVVIEASGLIDVNGLIASVTASDFILNRMKFQEKVQRAMNQLERKSKSRSSVVYIMDLQALKFDPYLIPAVTGPYINLWRGVYEHYPEWISNWFIINAPVFITTIWAAVSPLIEPNTVAKIQILGGKKEWLPKLLEHIAEDHLPEYWGGTMRDSDGDGKCPSKIQLVSERVPRALYWQPSEATPLYSDMPYISIAPGYVKVLSVVLMEPAPFLVYNLYSGLEYCSYSLFTPDTTQDPLEHKLGDLTEYHPSVAIPGMDTTDRVRLKTLGTGVYHIVLRNDVAWIRSVHLYYRLLFEREDGTMIRDSNPAENRSLAQEIMVMNADAKRKQEAK